MFSVFHTFLVCLGIVAPHSFYKTLWKRVLFHLFYSLFIFSIILYPLLVSLVSFIHTRDPIIISQFLFYLIIPVQYLLAIKYYSTNHLATILRDCYQHDYYIPKDLWLVVIILVGSISMTILTTWILGSGVELISYTFLFGSDWGSGRLLLVILPFFLSWTVLLSNMVVFCFVFFVHLRQLRDLLEYVTGKMIWNFDQTTLTELTRQIVGIRFVISQSVSNLENFYTFTTTLGALAIGPMLEFKKYDAYAILHVVLFFVLQCFFLYFIYFISKVRGDILKVVKSPSVMYKYLNNIRKTNSVEKLRNDHIACMNSGHHAGAIPYIFRNSFRTFQSNAGFNYDNENDSTVELTEDDRNRSKIMAYTRNENTDHAIIDIDELENNELISPRKKNKDFEDEMLTLMYKNNAELDWIVLEIVLSEKWTGFNLLGMNFNNSSAIKQCVGITSLIILASTYLNSLNLI